MLTANDIETVKATAPVVAEKALEITQAFYPRMFRENPEVRRFFNMAHQRTGGQPRALAGAISAYAAHIDNPAALVGAVELIAQKHCSLEVRADQYPIVGRNLLLAIQEVLGEAATPEILAAWERAYGLLADILISRENEIYEAQRGQVGGWTGRRPFVVRKKTPESEQITSFELTPEDGGALPRFKPGQYITVHVDDWSADASAPVSPRNYSLSSRPGLDHFRISVKRESAPADESGAPDGVVSQFLHDRVQEGDVLQIGPPCGEFVLQVEDSRPIVLLSGGVGVTPLLSMLHVLVDESPEVPVLFVHAARNGRVQALRSEVEALARRRSGIRTLTVYNEPEPEDLESGACVRTGFIERDWLAGELPAGDPDFYFCGPKPFMAALYRDLRELGVPDDRLHFEFFGPREEIESPQEALA